MSAAEDSVGAAFGGLCRLGKIEAVDGKMIEGATRTEGDGNEVAVYRLKPKAETAVAFQAFDMRSCGARG